MSSAPVLGEAGAQTAGILLLSVVAVAYGGTFLLKVVSGSAPATDFQRAWFRAGHAHAGVLVLLALVALLYRDAAGLDGPLADLGAGLLPVAAILVPAGFFLGAAGRERARPGPLAALLWAGVAVLAAGVVCLGLALLLV